MSEEEGKSSVTSHRRVSLARSLITNNQSSGVGQRVMMVNHERTLRLPVFQRMGKDDTKKHWLKCEEIWSMNRITNEASKITQLETTLRDRALT
jgi:hypothetical protein